MNMERLPTHSEVGRLISSLLPPKANDVSLLYHVPRGSYNFETAPVEQVILSVTPTANVYHAIGNPDEGAKTGSSEQREPSQEPRPPHTICFLHRPFDLDRHRVRKGVLVLASHTSFDENLTVGWNPALAERLGMDIRDSLVVQGYKRDPERRIGIVGRVSTILGPLLQAIETEFGAIEHAQEGLSEEISLIAIMNAFSHEEVDRVIDMAQEKKWIPWEFPLGQNVLYLTGQPRDSGLTAARKHGMTVVCVGHRVAEQWGIAYIAKQLRSTFPNVQVKEMYEDGLPTD
jgi:putative NIF3 family GTP cyclohydrolase 1 type 2